MPNGQHRLTAAQIRQANAPGLLADGAGLYLQVTRSRDAAVRKSWLLRFTAPDGRRREMGLGKLDHVSLADARRKADDARRLAAAGQDPIEARKADRTDARLAAARSMTFKQAATAYIQAHAASWSNAKHAYQWTRSLEMYAYPVFGDLPVDALDVTLVLRAIEPIWSNKTETASRVRGRIETILDWAAVRGLRPAENPARWRGHLQRVLPARGKVAPVQHHRALPIDETPAFMEALAGMPGLAPLALQFCILTATRTRETLQAQWPEFDLNDRSWTIPAERMKARRPHRIPLSPPAIAILTHVQPLRGPASWVFPSPRAVDRSLSNMAFLATLKRMNRRDITAHGFRSTFRDWAAERTEFAGDVAEAALAHLVSNRVEAAYRRGDLFEKRRALMAAWAQFSAAQTDNPRPAA